MFITEALSWKTAISPLMCIQASIGILRTRCEETLFLATDYGGRMERYSE